MDRAYDLDGLIRSIVSEETIYLRHYLAQVKDNSDPLNGGRVLVVIPSLGWDTQDKGQWARPRQMHALSVPKVDEWVEVYFINGSVNNLAYMGGALEMSQMKPENYIAATTHILWEMPGDKNQVIKFDANTKQFDMKFDKIIMNEGTEKYVLGDTAKTEWDKIKQMLTDLQTAFNTWAPVAPPGNGEAALKALLGAFLADTLPDFANVLSTAIKGK